MNEIFKQMTTALAVLLMLLITVLVPSADAASLASFSMNSSAREFEVSTLTYSLNKSSSESEYAIAEEFNDAIADSESVQYYKFNYTPAEGAAAADYISPGTFTYYMNRSSSVDEAVGKCKAAETITPITRIVKFYKNDSGVYSAVREGPQVINAETSLTLGRYPDSTVWKAAENTAYTDNSIGQIKFVFSKNLNKSSLDNIHVYLNDEAPSSEDEDLIKVLLFGEFFDRNLPGTLENELSGDIFMTYSQLKEILTAYNDDVAVTRVKIEVLATDDTWVNMTINIH